MLPTSVKGMCTNDRFARRVAFSTADETSDPFAIPIPTAPFLSPTATHARKRRRLPPRCTRVTRARSRIEDPKSSAFLSGFLDCDFLLSIVFYSLLDTLLETVE